MGEHLKPSHLAGPGPEVGPRLILSRFAEQYDIRVLQHVFRLLPVEKQAADKPAQPGLVAGQLTDEDLQIGRFSGHAIRLYILGDRGTSTAGTSTAGTSTTA